MRNRTAAARRTAIIASLGSMFALALPVLAKSPVDAVNQSRKGIAAKGYDVVAYFTQSAPVKGQEQFRHSWNGATFLFASAANRDAFAKSPEKYAPQFGGYCAWAVGHGYTADIDPEAWRIVNGKLYLNYSKDIQKKWMQDQDKWIMEGNRNWPSLHK
jgi:YHS domain-containing protein